MVNSVVLRRGQEVLSIKLPPLYEHVIRTPMTECQRELYRWALVAYAAVSYSDVPAAATTGVQSLNNLLMLLRRICIHPYLVNGVEPEPFHEGDHIFLTSCKFIVLDDILRKLGGGGVLIFSGFTTVLDIVQDYLNYK